MSSKYKKLKSKHTEPATEALHSAIKSKNYEELEQVIKQTFGDKLALNVKNESARAVALKTKYFSGYELLIKNDFRLKPNEIFNEIIEGFDDADKEKLRDIHIECASKPRQNYLEVIYSKCRAAHTTSKKNREKFEFLKVKVFKKLAAIEWIALLLQIIAFSDSLQIIFDFDRESVDHIDPTVSDNCLGFCFHDIGDILIGAKGLLSGKSDELCQVAGVLVHEICHYVMQLIYRNETNPYLECDLENETKFENILRECEINKHLEKIIRSVFNYEKKIQPCELIVRVVHLMAIYSSNDDRKTLATVQKNFSELFEYFKGKVVIDLKRELPKMEAKLKIKEINEICGLHYDLKFKTSNFKQEALEKFQKSFIKDLREKIQILTSNCVRLTMKAIFDALLIQNQLNETIFMKSESFTTKKINEMILKALKMFGNSMIVVECSKKDENLKNLTQTLTENNQSTRIIFVLPKSVESLCENTNKFEHSWSDLTEKSQGKILERGVNFQGIRLKLSQVLIKNSEAIKLIDFSELFNADEIKIGTEMKYEEDKVYIHRKFLKHNAKFNQLNQKYVPRPLKSIEAKFSNRKPTCILLIDEAGSGKSTELKKAAIKLKKIHRSHWVTYIDLKKHTEAFKENGNPETDGFKNSANFLAQNILKLKSFEAKLFIELYEADRVIFLFDGVDEISPTFNEFVVELMVQFKEKSKNQLMIASRPHLAEKLKMELKVESFKLAKFSRQDRDTFFRKCFDSLDKKAQEVVIQVITYLLFRIEKFALWNFPEEAVLNPMLLNMIADLFKYNPNFKLSKMSLFSIYDAFVGKFLQNLSEKGHDAVEDFEKFARKVKIEKYHQKKAFEKLFIHNDEDTSEVAKIFHDVKEISIDQKTRIGIIFPDENGNFNFIHLTFAEFFMAQYLFKELFEKKLVREEVGKLFCQVIAESRFDIVRNFMEDQLEAFEIDESLEITKTLLTYFKQHTFERYLEKNLGRIMHRLMSENCLSLIKLLSISLNKNDADLIAAWGLTALIPTIARSSFRFIQNLWAFAEEFFSEDQIKTFLTQQNSVDQTILNCSLENEDDKVFEFFLEIGRKYFVAKELDKILFPKRSLLSSYEILRSLSRCKKCLEKDDFKKLLTGLGQNDYTLLHKACIHDNDTFNAMADVLKQNLLPNEIKEMMLKVDTQKETFLMKAAGSKDKEHLKQVYKFTMKMFSEKELNDSLLQEDHLGLNILHHSARNNFSGTFKFIREIYKKKFGAEKVKEVLGKELKFGANVLNIAGHRMQKLPFERLWNFMWNLFGSEKLKEMLVQYCNYSSSGLIYDDMVFLQGNIPVIESFILKSCTDSASTATLHFWLFAANFSLLEFFGKLTSRVEENPEFAKIFYTKLFQFKNKKNKNILDYAANNYKQKSLDFKINNGENKLVEFLTKKSGFLNLL